MNQPSVMKHDFSRIPKADIQRSVFNRSHAHKTTFDAGKLVPFYADFAVPGDTFNLNATLFARLATPIYPIMDNMYMDVHFFSVPIRLIWDNFPKFMGEQLNPEDSTDFLVPQLAAPATTGWARHSIADYLGWPTGVADYAASALWHRGYNLCFREWYRDQNLQESPVCRTSDGPDIAAEYPLLTRGKRHDYFTSCLPWPQKGPAVSIPLGDRAEVVTSATPTIAGVYPTLTLADSGGGPIGGSSYALGAQGTSGALFGGTATAPANQAAFYPNNLYADLSEATASTINALRQAFQIQRLYERDARGGTRLIELVQAHFGVTSPDLRAVRPQYIGGTSAPLTLTQVPQTSPTGTYANTPQGNLAAYGTITAKAGFTYSFTEHCIVLGILSTRADLTYQQGLNRMYSYKTRWDMYWPALAHLGEQSVLNKEIYLQNTSADNDVFGYQERFAEMRYKPSMITGAMRSTDATTLDAWHLSQEFANLPVLNDEFIVENPPMDRVLAVSTQPDFIMDSFIQIRAARPMPTYGVPGMIDHF